MLSDITGSTLGVLLTSLLLISSTSVQAHGDHGTDHKNYNSQEEYNEKIPDEYNGSWERWHMAHEHEMTDFTPEAFFQIHAVSDPKLITRNDILRMYGLQREEVVGQGDGMGDHDNSENISPELKSKIVDTVLGMIDRDHNGVIEMSEYLDFCKNGGEFPDFGIGPGHEYDFEEEYEKHHWLKYHAEEDPDVKIMHKEDIEHELLHHFHEIEHDEEEDGKKKKYNVHIPILTKNIPSFFKY
ncbi:hypothetical protein C6P42_005308 [Pichia californica]|nr:hypothetical protein C6P42_005308 [[Candida] californica]